MNDVPTEIAVCPTCKRRLLTQTSALCNWCGAKIDNDEYQVRAAQTRQERDAQERAELESLIQEEAQHGILGRLKRLGKQNKKAPPKLVTTALRISAEGYAKKATIYATRPKRRAAEKHQFRVCHSWPPHGPHRRRSR